MIFSASKLRKKFTRRDVEFDAVLDADFFAWSGDFIAITGESGCGKSTLLSMLAGIFRPDSGDVILDGEKFGDMSDAELSDVRNRRIGYVPQTALFFPQYTVLENILLPKTFREGSSIQKEKCFENLDTDLQWNLAMLEISDLLDELPANLSGGELQKISIVRALVNHPGILIADEPTSSLDDRNTQLVLKLFSKQTAQGTAIIMVTHDEAALRRADRSYMMQRGQLIPREVSEYGYL